MKTNKMIDRISKVKIYISHFFKKVHKNMKTIKFLIYFLIRKKKLLIFKFLFKRSQCH